MTNKKAFKETCKFIAGGVNSPVRAFANVQSEPLFLMEKVLIFSI